MYKDSALALCTYLEKVCASIHNNILRFSSVFIHIQKTKQNFSLARRNGAMKEKASKEAKFNLFGSNIITAATTISSYPNTNYYYCGVEELSVYINR